MERAIAVDHQPRIGLQDRVRVEFVGHGPDHRFDPDIPGDVTPQFAFRYAEVAKRLWDAPPGMVADKEERRGALWPQRDDGRRIAGAKERGRERGHGRLPRK